MPPPLATPFGTEALRASIVALLPAEAPLSPPGRCGRKPYARVGSSLVPAENRRAQTLTLREAEGLIRIRHPTWGIVPPAYFIPDDGDPHLRAISDFVIGRAIEDWRGFLEQHGPLELAINLPIAFLKDPQAVDNLCRQIPDHPAFEGLIIEINGIDAVENLELLREVSDRLRFHKIAISIDDLGAEWPSLVGLNDSSIRRVKLIESSSPVALTTLERAVLASSRPCGWHGARTVAVGCRNPRGFHRVVRWVRSAQGFLFAKPMGGRSSHGGWGALHYSQRFNRF